MRAEAARIRRLRRLETVRAHARKTAALEAAQAESTLTQLEALAARTAAMAGDYRGRTTLRDGLELRQLSQFVAGLSGISATTLGDAAQARAMAALLNGATIVDRGDWPFWIASGVNRVSGSLKQVKSLGIDGDADRKIAVVEVSGAKISEAEALNLLRYFDLVDDTYGATETIIGDWFAARGTRDKVFLASKVIGRSPMPWMRPGGGETRITADQIDYALEGSLRRLRTDVIDLYQIHWPDRDVNKWGTLVHVDYPDDFSPFEAQLEALNRHVQAGKIRYVGVSNETPWGVMRFLAAAEKFGLPRLVSIQNAYSLVNRTFELGLSEIGLQEQVGLLPYSCLGQGYLTGKYQGGAMPEGTRKVMFGRLGRLLLLGGLKRLRVKSEELRVES